jgi:cell filamentation protein
MFCPAQNIHSFATSIFKELFEENFLVGLNNENFIKRISYYLGEINALHPFREGNGRTQRKFIECLGMAAGYNINFFEILGDEMIEASALSFKGNYAKMENIFLRIVSPISQEEQRSFIKKIALKNSKVLNAYNEYCVNHKIPVLQLKPSKENSR